MTYTFDQIKQRFDFEPNDQQLDAINKAVEWYKRYRDNYGVGVPQFFFLSGFAGVGKTTIAKIIIELCCTMRRCVVIAPTGKAAARLREKGCDAAMTMHQFIYNFVGEDSDGDPIFRAKRELEEQPLLVALDEASMVGKYDAERLLSHGHPVLALGDVGQLNPVKDAQFFTEDNMSVLLDKIERTNSSKIIAASQIVRSGKRLPFREYEECAIREGEPDAAVLKEFAKDENVILCARNNTRKYYNRRIRGLLGFTKVQSEHDSQMPQVGEKVVCLANQHDFGIMNGEQGVVLRYEPWRQSSEDDIGDDEDIPWMTLVLRSLVDGAERAVRFNPLCFTGTEDQKREYERKKGAFDFGYCLTVHKSQGSEWPQVMVIDEQIPGVPYAKLAYTAYTRAINRLVVYRA